MEIWIARKMMKLGWIPVSLWKADMPLEVVRKKEKEPLPPPPRMGMIMMIPPYSLLTSQWTSPVSVVRQCQ